MNATARHIALALIACALAVLGAAAAPLTHPIEGADDDDLVGIDLGAAPRRSDRRCKAAFRLESYRPGDVARLGSSSKRDARLAADLPRRHRDRRACAATTRWLGDAVSGAAARRIEPGRETRIRIGDWPSGFYFARLEDAKGRIGYAPFVLRPRRLGEHRVAVVLADADVAGVQPPRRRPRRQARHVVRQLEPPHGAGSHRPFENRGTPRHYRSYEEPFLRWLIATHHDVDYLSDRELKKVRSGADARARVRPDHLRGPPRVRDDARVRRRDRTTATAAAT